MEPAVPVLIDGAWLIRTAHPSTTRERVGIDTDALVDALADLCEQSFGHRRLGTIHWFDSTRANLPFYDLQSTLVRDDRFVLHLGRMRLRNDVWKQKQVDTALTTHMTNLAWWGHSRLMLVGGDEDLVPGILAAQHLGVHAHLVSVKFPHSPLSALDTVLGQQATSCSHLSLATARQVLPTHPSAEGFHLVSIAEAPIKHVDNSPTLETPPAEKLVGLAAVVAASQR